MRHPDTNPDQDGLFEPAAADAVPPGMVRYTEQDLFTAWKLPHADDRPLHLDTCHAHRADAADAGYEENFVYDHGFGGPCHFCRPR